MKMRKLFFKRLINSSHRPDDKTLDEEWPIISNNYGRKNMLITLYNFPRELTEEQCKDEGKRKFAFLILDFLQHLTIKIGNIVYKENAGILCLQSNTQYLFIRNLSSCFIFRPILSCLAVALFYQ